MLMTVLKGDLAVKQSKTLIRLFKRMKDFISQPQNIIKNNELLRIAWQTLDNTNEIAEIKENMVTKNNIGEIIRNFTPSLKKDYLFYDGQVFDAYNFISDLVRKAKKEIILIDNYIDDSVLKILNKRENNVIATIYTSHISDNLKIDLAKHNSQYQPINIELFNKSHDRFLIIDNEVYHIGASLKDLGKRMFVLSKLDFSKEEIICK